MLEKRFQQQQRRLQKLPKILTYLLIPNSSKERKTPHHKSRCHTECCNLQFMVPLMWLRLWANATSSPTVMVRSCILADRTLERREDFFPNVSECICSHVARAAA